MTEYLKQKETEKTQEGTQGKSYSSPHPGKSNLSHPGPALKQAILNMMKKDEKKKEEDKLKNNKRRQHDSISKRTSTKTKQTEKNPYSVFAENEEEVMDDGSVVFTEPSFSDHLPKGTPLT